MKKKYVTLLTAAVFSLQLVPVSANPLVGTSTDGKISATLDPVAEGIIRGVR
jgi:hypothetical protein